jgi:hypothetical protein
MGQNDWNVKLNTHLHLIPRLRMRGALTVLHLYIFMGWSLNTKLRVYRLAGTPPLATSNTAYEEPKFC